MNFSLGFLVALALTGSYGVTAGPVTRSSELHQVLEEFIRLVPTDKVLEIFVEYLEKDEQVQHVVEYIQTDGFKELVQKVESIKDVKNFYDYLNAAGLDVYGLVNKLHSLIGLPPLVPGNFARNVQMTGGMAGLIADIKAVLPIDDIKALYHKKLETSPEFARLAEHFKSPRFQELVNALWANPEYQKMLEYAKEHGVDVQAIMDLLTTMFGLEYPKKPVFFDVTFNHDLLGYL